MSSWDDRPILTKYTKKLMGIVDEERENSTLSIDDKDNKEKTSNTEPTKRKQVESRKKSYEYPYARKPSKEGTQDSINLKSEPSDLALNSKTKNEILLNNVKKKFSIDEQPLMVQTPNKITIKQKAPDRNKPMKIERLQRLYEDEFLARKPIRFNSFDMFEDKIGAKHENKTPKALVFREASLDSIDTQARNAKLANKFPNRSKRASFSSIPNVPYSYSLQEENESIGSNEDEDVGGDSDEFEDEIIEIRRFRPTPRPSVVALSTTSSNNSGSSTPQQLTYEYKSPRMAAINLPLITTATQPVPGTPLTAGMPIPAVVPVTVPVQVPTVVPVPVAAPVPVPIAAAVPTPLPRSSIPVPITTVVRPPNLIQAPLPPRTPQSKRRTVRFNQMLDDHYSVNLTKVEFNEHDDIVGKKRQPNLHMKPVKSILRNRMFTPDNSFSVNY